MKLFLTTLVMLLFAITVSAQTSDVSKLILKNGDELYIEELGGYEIRYKKTTDTKYTYLSIY